MTLYQKVPPPQDVTITNGSVDLAVLPARVELQPGPPAAGTLPTPQDVLPPAEGSATDEIQPVELPVDADQTDDLKPVIVVPQS